MSSVRLLPIRRALFSVYEKEGIVELARVLAAHGAELLATGSTADHLEKAGLAVRRVEELSGFGELFDGRVKTLTPGVHGGLLMRRDSARDREQAEAHGIVPIDLLCVRLYPFVETVRDHGQDRARCLEMIDVGGPAMIRAAAKNHRDVVVVSSPGQCAAVAQEIERTGGAVAEELAARLAVEAFALTAAYDAAILRYLAGGAVLLDHWAAGGRRWMPLRYGENPAQAAACYLTGHSFWSALTMHQGKELSFNNLADLWAGWRALGSFPECAAVVIKHRTPSGLALAQSPVAAYRRARDADPLSAFGGIVLVNRPGDAALAEELAALFLEVVGAPGWSGEALALLRRKKNLRVLAWPAGTAVDTGPGFEFASLGDAVLVQQPLRAPAGPDRWQCATRERADEATLAELDFAWRVVRHVRSNAIALTRGRQTLGLGCGQTSRIDACELALMKAGRCGHSIAGAVLASDAFFPFSDVVIRAGEAGVRAMVQPGGSRNDAESITACDERGIAMYLTGERVFAH